MQAAHQAFHRAATTGRSDSQDAERLVFSPKGHGGSAAEAANGGMPHTHRTVSGKRGSSGRQRYRACECALLVLMATCIAVSFMRFHAHIRALEAMEGDTAAIDVVGVSLRPSCVTRQAIASLNLYLKPRTIHVVTTSEAKCRIYNSFASNVDCHIQDGFLPGVTTDAIGDYIRDHIGVDEHKEFKVDWGGGQNRAGTAWNARMELLRVVVCDAKWTESRGGSRAQPAGLAVLQAAAPGERGTGLML